MVNLTLFSQIAGKLDRAIFSKLVKEKDTDKYFKDFSSWDHLISMLFCHFAKSQSLRDIGNSLRSATGNLNYLRVHKTPSKSNLSYQNKEHDWILFQDCNIAVKSLLLLETLVCIYYSRAIKFSLKDANNQGVTQYNETNPLLISGILIIVMY